MLISSKITRFATILTKNFLGEDPQPPVHPAPVTSLSHLPKLKSIISNVFYMEEKTRDVIFIKSIVCKAVSVAKIDFDHTKAIDTEAPIPFSYVCVCVCVWFYFFACQKFRKVGHPPWRKFLDPRLFGICL